MAPPTALPLALTMGDPAGIGPDIALAAWARRVELSLPPFYLIADSDVLRERASLIGLTVPLAECEPAEATVRFAEALPVSPLAVDGTVEPGHPSPTHGAAVIAAIDQAVRDVASGRAAAIVTNPITKSALYEVGFRHPGHTEFLAVLSEMQDGVPRRPVMMLAGPELRVVPVTIHNPLHDVAELLTTELIVDTGRIVAEGLRSAFDIPSPRLALAGLNPHAGEGGALGGEDLEVIAPAVETLRRDGIEARGPLPADTMFHAAARSSYDAALCMYHDQALIPVKMLDFANTVNVTLGLSFIRTSPDHGTAHDIAGSGAADPSSLVAALRMAAGMAERTAMGGAR